MKIKHKHYTCSLEDCTRTADRRCDKCKTMLCQKHTKTKEEDFDIVWHFCVDCYEKEKEFDKQRAIEYKKFKIEDAKRIKKYSVIDDQGANMMSYTWDEPMTEQELLDQFWSHNECRTKNKEDFTLDYIADAWEVTFIERELDDKGNVIDDCKQNDYKWNK